MGVEVGVGKGEMVEAGKGGGGERGDGRGEDEKWGAFKSGTG